MAGGSPPSGPARHWRTRWRIGSRRTSRRPAAARFPGRSS
jgi:hypothetical protein